MGCGGSKADDVSLLALCRERKQHIKAASEYRYALAASHVAYFHSLRDVGEAILKFVEEEFVVGSSTSPSSPVLTLPSRDGKSKQGNASSSSSTTISHSLEGSSKVGAHHHHHHRDGEIDLEDSHLQLSSSDDDVPDSDHESGSGHIRFHDHGHGRGHGKEEEAGEDRSYDDSNNIYNNSNANSSYYYYPSPGRPPPAPQPQGNWGYGYQEANNPYSDFNPYPNQYAYGNTNFNAYYMKKSATPAKTLVYEDPSTTGYSGSGYYGNDVGNNNGFFFYPPGMMRGYPSPARREPSPERRRPPPAPPSPPKVSTWDFLNVFESVDGGANGYYPGYYPTRRFGYGYRSSTSSPDSKEVREREGIPELEDETENEVIKEAYFDKEEKNIKKKKSGEEVSGNVKSSSNFKEEMEGGFREGGLKSVKIPVVNGSRSGSLESGKGKGIKSSASPDTFRSPESIVGMSPEEEEEIAQFVKRKGVSFEVEEAPMDFESSKFSSLTTLSAQGTRDLQEVVKEIRDEFESATSYGKEVAVMLEVGKLPYQRRSTLFKVFFSRILYLVSSHPPTRPSVHISSRTMKMAKAYSGEPGTDFDLDTRNLSSTLHQLYVWEKRLYKEVKGEERLRAIYDRMCKRLQTLYERGAESSKIDATQASIRKLLTKINVCIRAVDAISNKIHRLRDEELWPQISDLIYGLIRMWKSMLRCHQKQFQAIMESKVRYLKANTGLHGDSGLRATIDLENELMNWCTRFNKWIISQKSYIQSLNEWLYRCLNHEPEETADGPAPFSPSRIGAPPIFVICNDWHQAMATISEKGVENTMLDFASKLHQLWERQEEEQRQRSKAEYVRKDFEKRLRALRTERGKIEQEHDASSDKAMSKVPSESGVSRLDDLKVDLDTMRKKLEEERGRHKEAAKVLHNIASSSVQAGLVPIFEALGNFTSEVLKAHEQVRLQYTGCS